MSTVPPADGHRPPRWRFGLPEISGAFGDLGTFLPLAVAMSLVCELDFGLVLICAGAANIAAGLWLRQPIPVQPMKAIAAVAIAEGLGHGELIAAGLWMGVLLSCLAATGAIDVINRVVPKPVVRGIQLGVGIKLAIKGLSWVGEMDLTGYDSVATSALFALVLFVLLVRRLPAALIVFASGFILLWLHRPETFAAVAIDPATARFYWPATGDWLDGLTRGALPQLPLTVLNSVVAVCALSADYFPGRGVPPRRMAAAVGLTNLFAVPLGGIPMCHGAGGLAAQHRFGARTGGSVLMLGALKMTVGLAFGGSLVGVLAAYPKAALSSLIVLAGFELARVASGIRGRTDVVVAVLTASGILVADTFVGFSVGLAVVAAHRLFERNRGDCPDGHGRPSARRRMTAAREERAS